MGAVNTQIGGDRDGTGEGYFFEGDEELLNFPMLNEFGNPLDLANATTIQFDLYEKESDSTESANAIFTKTQSGGDITLDDNDNDGTDETAVVEFLESDTVNITDGFKKDFYYELWIEHSGDKQTMAFGKFVIHPSGK